MNNENLKPYRTSEEARKAGAKGGKKAAATKRRRKQLVTQLKAVIQNPVIDEKIKKKLQQDGFEATYGGMILHGIVNRAGHNSNMARLLFDLIGESPDVKLKKKELELKAKMMEKDELDTGSGEVVVIDDTGKTE